jgi:Tfp pilus assembly protein PilN
MIRINLLPGQQKRKTGPKFQFSADFLKDWAKQVKDPLLLGVVGAWAAAVLVVGGLWALQAGQLALLNNEHTRVEAEARRYRTLIQQKRRAEALQDSLIAELRAIREIDGDRYVWPHVLEEVTKALPDYTWLTSIETVTPRLEETADSTVKPPVTFTIEGRTNDLGAYTRFVSQLTSSPWIQSAEFGAVQSVVEDDRPLNSFTVTATFRVADSAFIRTVPVQQSVR